WKGIRNYYADYAGRNANTEDFRLKMESVCGQDLKNFFQQWLYRAGQPKLEIKWNYNAAKKLITITLTQQQIDLFEFPLELKLEAVGKSTNKTVLVKDKINAIIMPVETKPSRIFSDPNVSLLFEVETKEIK
ncbi:MAG TPA: hypothetical protein VNX68_00880, partial [Nitrosopumilaceae archaeon]|nr:hypothetical protein [Nitrosopumilaceae archaeon]